MVKLNSGFEMPIIGLGTYLTEPGVAKQCVIDAIDAGYRHIDTAYLYDNEKEVGEAIKDRIEKGVIKRADIFVTTKIWNTFHKGDKTVRMLKRQLELLGLDYVDLYLMHWPCGFREEEDLTKIELIPKDEAGNLISTDIDYLETYKGLEECVKEGLTKSIGLSNFNSQQIQRVLDNCSIKPTVNQVECHPWLNQSKLLKFCMDRDIFLTAFAPLGAPGLPILGDKPRLLNDPKVKEIAEKLGKDPGQVLIRYQIERNVIVIPKSIRKERIISNFNVFDFQLGADNLATLDSMNIANGDGRIFAVKWMSQNKNFPFGIEF